jgi:hypothetical protein
MHLSAIRAIRFSIAQSGPKQLIEGPAGNKIQNFRLRLQPAFPTGYWYREATASHRDITRGQAIARRFNVDLTPGGACNAANEVCAGPMIPPLFIRSRNSASSSVL